MHNRHAWTERNEEGTKREIRVIKSGGTWRFQSKSAGETHWTYYDEPLLPDLEEFHQILLRKYQRRRASHGDVVWAERELTRLRNRVC
jgi:hypothetical protein